MFFFKFRTFFILVLISAICWPIWIKNSVLERLLVVDYMTEIRMWNFKNFMGKPKFDKLWGVPKLFLHSVHQELHTIEIFFLWGVEKFSFQIDISGELYWIKCTKLLVFSGVLSSKNFSPGHAYWSTRQKQRKHIIFF